MSDDAERVWLLMQRFVDTHSRHRAMAEALGFSLGAGRGRVLSALLDSSLSLSDLATRVGFDPPYTTRVVDDLQQRGLVERRPHPDDGRRKLVALTASGHGALTQVDAVRREPPAALGTLGADEVRAVLTALERLAAD